MGYYTKYKLTFPDQKRTVPQCEHHVHKGVKYCPECGARVRQIPVTEAVWHEIQAIGDLMAFALGTGPDCGGEPDSQWDWEGDMRALSKKFGDMLFILHGDGEEQGDVWRAYFLDGKMQECKAQITFDRFDSKKLK